MNRNSFKNYNLNLQVGHSLEGHH